MNDVYWGIADYINVFENSAAVYKRTSIGSLTGNGQFSDQATLIMYGYAGNAKALKKDVDAILSFQKDAIAGMYISDRNVYTIFPTNWATFVKDVAAVVKVNKSG